MTYPKFRRRKYIVKPGFQVKNALIVILSIILYSLILGVFIFYPLSGELVSALGIDEQANVSATILHLHERIWPGLLVVAVLAGVHVILSTHRVVGPVYRFETFLADLAKGDFSSRVRLRKGDNFRETEEVINRLADYLDDVKTCDDEFHAGMKRRFKDFSQTLNAPGEVDMENARRALRDIIRELDSYGGAFSAASGSSAS
jgi:hypothetical protein